MKVRDTILLVDHIQPDREFLRSTFEENYNLLEAENVDQALLLLEQNQQCIAAVLLDLGLPNEGGLFLLRECARRGLHTQFPSVGIVHRGEDELEASAFYLGADEVLTKPFRPVVIQQRVKTVIELYHQKRDLEQRVEEQTAILRRSNESMVDSLCAIIETRSAESGLHILRIRQFTRLLLEELARNCPEYQLNETTVQIITSAAALHDIGKIGIPDAILNKPGRLDPDEFETMKTHTTIGCQMLEELHAVGNDEYLRYAHNICHYHHERWDGKGYPEGLRADDIPICAQVVGLADAFDALTNSRVYKEAYSFERASTMILNGECGLFSPKLLEGFKRLQSEFARIAQTYADGHSPKSDSITLPLLRPSAKDIGPDSLQATHAKLRTTLHYLGSTVAEVDLDTNVFHLLYNPHPEFTGLHTAESFEHALSTLAEEALHPDDRHLITDDLNSYLQSFMDSGLRRLTRHYRIFNAAHGDYRTFAATALRIDMEDPDRRQMLALWTPVDELPTHPSVGTDAQQALYGIMGLVACRMDRRLTIERSGGSFLTMLGYGQDDLAEATESGLMGLMDETDRPAFARAMTEQLRDSNHIVQECRLRRKDGTAFWALIKGRIVPGADGLERLFVMINDVSAFHEERSALERSIERLQTILSQTSDIVFELDLDADMLTCSSHWQDLFGYAPISQNFSTEVLRASHIHPDDLPLVLAQFRRAQTGESQLELEARIAGADGRYLWVRIRASMQRDTDGRPTHVIGVIINIDSEKRAAQALLNRAERDPLTKLLNKETCRLRTEEYLKDANGAMGAMLIIDLDHFKEVNDRFGHLFGDVVLTRVAEELRRLFRESDILGRIGGDEFMVFMKNIPGKTLVEERCKRLLDLFQSIYPEQLAECGFSCSIGVSFFPEFGRDYQELFRRADWALYQTKALGRNGYQFYRSDMTGMSTPQGRTRIDSNEQPGLAEDSLLRYVFHQLYESDDVEGTIQSMLALLGSHTNVSRVYIFENSPDNTTCSNTFEWCNEGITPEIAGLQNISYETDIPGYKQCLDEQDILYCTDIAQLPEDLYAILAPQGIKSLLHCAIRDGGQFRGYVGFDDCTAHRIWTREQIDLLTFLAQTISMFLLKKRAQDAAQMQMQDLRNALDKQAAWVYIIDPETHELRFNNARTRALAPNVTEGMLCYEAFRGFDAPCDICPAKNLHDPNTPHTCVVDNHKLALRVRAQAEPIHWQGKDACLISCVEL